MPIGPLPPVNSADGLMSPVLIQHLPVVNEAPLELLAVEQSVPHLKARRPRFETPTPFGNTGFLCLSTSSPDFIRPWFGWAKRLCVGVTGVGAIAGHFHTVTSLMHFCQRTFSPILLGRLWRARRAGPSQTLLRALEVQVEA